MQATPQEKWPPTENVSGPEKPRRERAEETRARFEALAAAARRKTLNLISKRQKLIANLRSDLEKHGDAEQWKRFGDLVLANIGTAERQGDHVIVTDYFDDDAPKMKIDAERHIPLNEVAEGYFRRYVKARNGKRVIAQRIEATEAEIERRRETLDKIDAAIEAGDEAYLEAVIDPTAKPLFSRQKKKVEAGFKGARRFVSSDGFEILVGKKAKDNDFLTFRVAKSLDLWLHAADYPGSHVVVRNDRRNEIPPKTLLEAAQLAAFYSDAREKPKAAVNYTEKKFVNKPKRSAPGLVRLASFKTILVEPQVPEFKLPQP
ncbi:MAG TPA: NFACT RNA binding domain-containing protein [Pyrinomonadaceae bacterium]|nr:NFACT RNA binding domain-containing protein [Pyrinomonadaceae bacterium]